MAGDETQAHRQANHQHNEDFWHLRIRKSTPAHSSGSSGYFKFNKKCIHDDNLIHLKELQYFFKTITTSKPFISHSLEWFYTQKIKFLL